TCRFPIRFDGFSPASEARELDREHALEGRPARGGKGDRERLPARRHARVAGEIQAFPHRLRVRGHGGRDARVSHQRRRRDEQERAQNASLFTTYGTWPGE